MSMNALITRLESMDALLTRLEEGAGSDVERVLAATKDAYSRRAYGEKAWKAAAELLVKEYGAADAAKIMHHKAMRRAHDAAMPDRSVKGIVASVKKTIGTWPAKEIVADIGNSVELDEGIGDAFKSAVGKVKSMFGRNKGGKSKGDEPDYWRTVRGQHIGFDGKPGSGEPVVGAKEIVSRLQGKGYAKSAPASGGGGGSSGGGNVDVKQRNIEPPSSSTKRSDGPPQPKYMTYDLSKEATDKRRAEIEAKMPPTPLGIEVEKTTKGEREANDWLYRGEKDHPNRPVEISDKDRKDLVAMVKKIDPSLDLPFDDLDQFRRVQSKLIKAMGKTSKNHSDTHDALRKIREKHRDSIEGNKGSRPLTQDEVDEIDKAYDETEKASVASKRLIGLSDALGDVIKKNKR